MRAHSRRRSGFSTINLLVLLAILGFLAALLLTAVAGANQAARRLGCVNNMRQLGIACHVFHDTFEYFPTEQGDKQYPFPSTGFYTQICPFVEQANADPKKPKPIKLFMCPDRHQPTAPYRDYVYVSVKTSILGNPNAGASLVAIVNANGASNTALLAHCWMDPDKYAADKATWADKTQSVPSAENKRDSRASADGSSQKAPGSTTTAPPAAKSACLGSPHPKGNPYLFADGHVQSIPYGWNNPKGAQEWVWNWQNTNALNLP